MTAIEVVAKRDYKIERKSLALLIHLIGGLKFRFTAGAHVADSCEANGVGLKREFELVGALGGRKSKKKSDEEKSTP
jgi:hypothetical protein